MSHSDEASKFADVAHIGAWATIQTTMLNAMDEILLEGVTEEKSQGLQC
jgi:hypothetical protein